MNKLIIKVVAIVGAFYTFSMARASEQETIDLLIAGNGPTNIVSSVTSTRAYAFAFNRTVESVTLPELQHPAAMMFNGCASLRVVSMPALANTPEVERCLVGMFSGCPRLEAVDLTGIEYETANITLPLGVPPTNRKVRFHFKDGIRDASGKAVAE